MKLIEKIKKIKIIQLTDNRNQYQKKRKSNMVGLKIKNKN